MAATGPMRQAEPIWLGLFRYAADRMRAMTSLPGNDLIAAGVEDLRNHKQTIEALLVAIGAPKLRSLGLELPENLPTSPENRLYDLYLRLNPIQPTPDTMP